MSSAEKLALLAELDELEITLVGLCTDICVVSNALLVKAFLPETTVRVIADCCAGVTPESHKVALNTMRMCQIQIQSGTADHQHVQGPSVLVSIQPQADVPGEELVLLLRKLGAERI